MPDDVRKPEVIETTVGESAAELGGVASAPMIA
jgi:hypothetical protein